MRGYGSSKVQHLSKSPNAATPGFPGESFLKRKETGVPPHPDTCRHAMTKLIRFSMVGTRFQPKCFEQFKSEFTGIYEQDIAKCTKACLVKSARRLQRRVLASSRRLFKIQSGSNIYPAAMH